MSETKYIEKTLSSGRKVEIRPLTWQEFWNITKAKVEKTKEMKNLANGINETDENPINELDFIVKAQDERENILSNHVKDWHNINHEIMLYEVLEIEQLIEIVSKNPIEMGNLKLVGNTMEIPTG